MKALTVGLLALVLLGTLLVGGCSASTSNSLEVSDLPPPPPPPPGPVANGDVVYVGDAPAPEGYVACTAEQRESDVCTLEYAPVCGAVDNGIRCVAFPCPSVDWKEYSNACSACTNADVYGYTPGPCNA